MNESTPKVIDQNRFETSFGAPNQAEIFQTIANYVKNTGDTVETVTLNTGKDRFQATVTFYTNDLGKLPLRSLAPSVEYKIVDVHGEPWLFTDQSGTLGPASYQNFLDYATTEQKELWKDYHWDF